MTDNEPQPSSPDATAGAAVTIIRRGRASFTPRPAPADRGVVINRNILGARRTDTRAQTKRERKIAGTLPTWEPLPPGELLVHRGSSA